MLRYFLGLSLLTVSIIAIRFFTDKKISRKFQYALWILIPLYMCIAPFFTIDISLPAKVIIVQEQATETVGVSEINIIEGVPLPIQNTTRDETEISVPIKKPIDWSVVIRSTALIVTGALLIALLIYNLGFVSYCRRKRQFIKRDSKYGLRIFRLDHPNAPFLLGNCIYLSDEIADSEMCEYVICHECCHYKHLDHVWILIRYIVLILNWFNPLIWYAFRLTEEDCELACDEEVISQLGEDKRVNYGKVLLSLLTKETKRNFYVSTAMNGRGESFMKKRIKNIKDPRKSSVTAVILVSVMALSMVGCSLVDVNQETVEVVVPSTETEQSESSAAVQKLASLPHPDDLYTIETIYKNEVLPTDGKLADGFYTVSMTPNYGVNDNGYKCVFYPWTQLEVSKEFIDSLEEGMILDFTGWLELNTVTVQSVDTMKIEPYSYMGTDYTGEVVNLTTNKDNICFCKVDGADTWKALIMPKSEPLRMYNNPVSVDVADDCIIYDAVSVLNSIDLNSPETSQIDLQAVSDFSDKETTKGVTVSIKDFFDKWHCDRFDYTVVKIENNTVTEVYFWHS